MTVDRYRIYLYDLYDLDRDLSHLVHNCDDAKKRSRDSLQASWKPSDGRQSVTALNKHGVATIIINVKIIFWLCPRGFGAAAP